VSTNLPGAAVACFAEDLAGVVVEVTCEKVIPVKNTRILKVIRILDAVFIICLF
jgi:hypothetical protein